MFDVLRETLGRGWDAALLDFLTAGAVKAFIVPRTKGILDYFGDDDIFFFEPGNVRSLADTIERVRSDAALRARVLSRGAKVYRRHSWKNERRNWLAIVRALLGSKVPDTITSSASENSLKVR